MVRRQQPGAGEDKPADVKPADQLIDLPIDEDEAPSQKEEEVAGRWFVWLTYVSGVDLLKHVKDMVIAATELERSHHTN